ncbi:MAG: translocation/assembly module TamB domain-containing protein [Candidatus Aminicenantaceae bacterium]
MKIGKKIRLLGVFIIVIFLLIGAGVLAKNIILHQLEKRIHEKYDYKRLTFSIFPPVLTLEDFRTDSFSPFLSADKIVVRISYKSIFSRRKPLIVYIDKPLLRVYESFLKKDETNELKIRFPFPFEIEKGLIKDGEFYYWGKEFSFQSQGVKALVLNKKNSFSLRIKAEKNTLYSRILPRPLEGRMEYFLQGNHDEISVRKMIIDSPDLIVKGEGNLNNLSNPDIRLKTFVKIRTDLIASYLNIPFDWEGKIEGNGMLSRDNEIIVFDTEFSSNDIILNGLPVGKVKGKVNFIQDHGGTVEFNVWEGALPSEFGRINFTKEKVEGHIRGVFLDPILKKVSVPWPVASPVWGTFLVKDKELTVNGEFRDKYLKKGDYRFPFRGRVKFKWDGKNDISFSSENLASNFFDVGLKAKINLIGDLDVQIDGKVSDVKKARKFTSIILNEEFNIPEIRGSGDASIHIFEQYRNPQVEAEFSFSPGGYGKFNAQSVKGEAELIKNDFLGNFVIDDPFLEARIGVVSNRERTRADIQLERGYIENILPALDLNLPLKGEASGRFKYLKKDNDASVEGGFSGEQIKISGQELKDVKSRLIWKNDSISFPHFECRFYKGNIKGQGALKPSNNEFDIDISGDRIDLSSVNKDLKGSLSFVLKGSGFFGQDTASGSYEIKELSYKSLQKTKAKGNLNFGLDNQNIFLEIEGNLFPGNNNYNATCLFPVNEKSFTADIKGNLNNLDLLLPWKGGKGTINYLGELKGKLLSPEIKGVIDFKGSVLPISRFPQAFRNYSGLIFVENEKISLRSFQANLGGGDVRGDGVIELANGKMEDIDLKMEGEVLLLVPLERTRVLTDGYLNFVKNNDRYQLNGNFDISRLLWKRELNEEFNFFSNSLSKDEDGSDFLSNLNLNIQLNADDNAWMENSLGKVKGRFDLTVTGTVSSPVLLGDIEAIEGKVYFQDREFKVLTGRVSFFNPTAIEPYLNFRGETYVKDYHVMFSLNGLLNKLTPEFSSSPPLPPEDVLALLTLGESFRRTYSYDASAQQSSASLLSFQLAEEATKRAEKLLSIDRFRIEPFILGSSAEMMARLTLGKKISKKIFFLYSTNLSSQREDITRLEWQLTDDISIVSTSNEEGRISIDVKIHKRF